MLRHPDPGLTNRAWIWPGMHCENVVTDLHLNLTLHKILHRLGKIELPLPLKSVSEGLGSGSGLSNKETLLSIGSGSGIGLKLIGSGKSVEKKKNQLVWIKDPDLGYQIR